MAFFMAQKKWSPGDSNPKDQDDKPDLEPIRNEPHKESCIFQLVCGFFIVYFKNFSGTQKYFLILVIHSLKYSHFVEKRSGKIAKARQQCIRPILHTEKLFKGKFLLDILIIFSTHFSIKFSWVIIQKNNINCLSA